MNRVVADTDVVSFLFKNHPIGRRYDPELAGRVVLISFMTVAEVERWAIQHRWSEHRVHWLHSRSSFPAASENEDDRPGGLSYDAIPTIGVSLPCG